MGFEDFLKLYQNVFGEKLPDQTRKRLEVARRVRNQTLHGKHVEPAKFREAIVDVLIRAEEINAPVYHKAQFKPFGSMQGYKGAASDQLPKETTRWLLHGLSAGLRKNSDDD